MAFTLAVHRSGAIVAFHQDSGLLCPIMNVSGELILQLVKQASIGR